ncbi:MAG: glucuronate isomerase [Candidatus Omnitrophica bacterium]|nr:glucuronate isomerase [Candidatus Omnitrophota bacterium]
MRFLGGNYLLGNNTAKRIFKRIKGLPVVDPHNHANVKEIAENKNYPDPWQLFAGTDHYVWSVLRKCGVPERYITGDAKPEEKWIKMAEVFPLIAGNPVYEWVHLDLKRYFSIEEVLCRKTGEKIWDVLCKKLALPENRPQEILKRANVEVMCSTDDPVDILKPHRDVNRMMGKMILRPTWRPDRITKITSPDWRQYLSKLETRFNIKCSSINDLVDILKASHDYFSEYGCVASDHGVEVPYPAITEEKDADKVFKKALKGEKISSSDVYIFSDYLFGVMAELDAEKNWVFQLHIGAVRDTRKMLFEVLGQDSGGDVSNHYLDILTPLVAFLNRFENRLKTVLYCLDTSHQQTLATVSRAFGTNVRLGAAWWFLDTPYGMKKQLQFIGTIDLLSTFAGMVSDSRKILSYGSRFEMFRRVLSDVLGEMVEKWQMPEDVAEDIANRVAYKNPKEFFGL